MGATTVRTLFILLTLSAVAAAHSQATSCETLAQRVNLRNTRIELSAATTGATFTPPGATEPLTGLPKFCRVAAVVAPAIGFEVWLPLENWNGKFNAVGGSGFAGVISYAEMASALKRGYATASTDTGHVATDTTWLRDHGRLIDHGYRAIREMTVKSKEILRRFYGRRAQYSYFTGCSTGGRQGLMEVERYPEDYDGVLAGAPVNTLVEDILAHLWVAQAVLNNPASNLPPEKLAVLTNAVLAQCDARDGVIDGVLENPRSCDFDAARVQCQPGQDPNACLTAPQVETARKIYAGPSRPGTGARISWGFEPGSERLWSLLTARSRPSSVADSVAPAVDANYDFRTYNFDSHADLMYARLRDIWNATNPDLLRAERKGTKIILYHGWNDWGIPPGNTVSYYEKVKAFIDRRGRNADDFMRLFMLPGVEHCGGGAGPDQFDGLKALEEWVERGVAPERIVASHLSNGAVDKTRPLCPYPKIAVYDGRGDTNSAASFHCGKP